MTLVQFPAMGLQHLRRRAAMSSIAAKTKAVADREPLHCKRCGRALRMQNGHILACACGAPRPRGCWTRRAVAAPGGGGPALAYLERLEHARKPCTAPGCEGTMVYSGKTVCAWTCRKCGRQDKVAS